MYRHVNEPFDSGQEAELPGSGRRHFAPVPLGFFGALLGLAAEFFGLFLLAWGVAPTSDGCGAGRAATMGVAQLAIGAAIYLAFVGVGVGIMREARESTYRKRAFVVTFTVTFLIGSLPLLAMAPLFGSCFDF